MTKENDSTTIVALVAAVSIAVIGVAIALYALALEPTSEKDEAKSTHANTHHYSHEAGEKHTQTISDSEASVVITYTNEGFENAVYTVNSGETVRVANKSKIEMYFTTGNHHNHDINSPLSLGVIAPGESSSFVAPKPGKYGFHNHENEHQAGELIVK